MTHFADGVTIGRRDAYGKAGVSLLGPKSIAMGFAPATLDRDGFAAAQTLAGAGDLILNGALVTNGVGIADVARCASLYSTGNFAALSFTFYGYDILGQACVAVIAAGPNNTTVATTKAFKRVTRIAASGVVGTAIEAGTVDVFGLPRRLADKGQIIRIGWDDLLPDNAGTVVKADLTSPSTAATGDPRGTVAPAGNPANGTRVLWASMFVDLTSRITEFGVENFGTGV